MQELLIFDIDGVIRDSSRAVNEGYRRGFEAVGKEYKFEPADPWHLRGLSKYNNSPDCIKALLAFAYSKTSIKKITDQDDAEDVIERLIAKYLDESDLDEVRRIYQTYAVFFDSAEAKKLVTIFPDARKIFTNLKRLGYALALFTNATRVSVERDLEGIGLGLFSCVMCREDVKHSKPSGEGIIKIMELLHFEPRDTYYIGDAASDIAAAKDAKCNAVALFSGMGTKSQISRAKPDFEYDDLSVLSDYFSKRR